VRSLFALLIASSSSLAACGGETTTPPVTVDPKVAAGGLVYVKYACAQCHGLDGAGKTFGTKVATPINNYPAAQEMVVRIYINSGKGINAANPPGQVFMPSWSRVMTTPELDNLVAFILAKEPAVEGVALVSPTGTDAAAGAKVYTAFACQTCHGVSGAGGVANPGGDGDVIPALAGAAFKTEFDTAEKIKDIITNGAIIGQPPIVSMPGWKGVMTADQITAVTAYIQSLP